MQSFKTSGYVPSVSTFFMGLIDVLTPTFPSHLTCCGIQHLELLLAAKDTFREKRRGENMWEKKEN